ncbi:hypothetical protein [Enterococcus faecalis]|uniref:hypothetical protein n=1 Tax=Enterococcus faecalis TaxID=1351 RepID=UPI001156F23F|nr:hypothetical protein [Enterococcus faecalis]MEB7945134.1 hypothetical protein [Enterococcus faecalis]HAP4679755.1 hypothetical protein [Enterococcus faecalis]HAP4685810.1 hypothetical protein [Enterococcus faecalis]HAP4688902.1 hypothetical protein [Enterococcus faecalis]
MRFIEVVDIDNSILKIINIEDIKNVQKGKYAGRTHIVLRDGHVITVIDDLEIIKCKIVNAGGCIY